MPFQEKKNLWILRLIWKISIYSPQREKRDLVKIESLLLLIKEIIV